VVIGKDGLWGELLFAEGLHGEPADAEAQCRLGELFGTADERRRIRAELQARCQARVERERPAIVGLTTSCNQLLPALWLARVIKRGLPATTVVLGGAACTEPMGQRILEAYAQVDHVVSGYGEQPLLALSRGEVMGQRLISSQQALAWEHTPLPDYSTFLSEAEQCGHELRLVLTFRSSRGCWWGQKQHCNFCGLNGNQLKFEAKSSERVVQEIRTLWERHGRNLLATDAILSRDHLKHVLPELARWESRPRVFYEMKTNMTQAEVIALARAGVLGQLGVESLSSRLLRLLRKGVTAICNLAVLKWCRERRVAVVWNQLCGIPGEQSQDYEAQISLMRQIPQLPPPKRANPISIDRFSPYFNDFRGHGWPAIEPRPEYRFLHPQLDQPALRDIAYHFQGVDGGLPMPYLARFEAAVEQWQQRNRRGEGLFLHPVQGLVRNGENTAQRFRTDGMLGRVIDCTHEIAPIPQVLAQAGCDRAFLDQMVERGLLCIEDNRVLNLAVRVQLPDAAG
jgi:ribosomal peptide maturation radical SAM protein 1